MKIRTLEELSSALDQDIAWRKKELSVFSHTVGKASGAAIDACVRAGVALLYAHWEGFIKHAAECYVHFVGRRRLETGQLSIPFIGLAVKKAIENMRGSPGAESINAMIERVFASPTMPCPIPWRDEIQTRSNLSSLVLKDIVISLGLDYSVFEGKSVMIDEQLLGNRNRIAHGKYVFVDREYFFELRKNTVSLMEAFRAQIENGAVCGYYRKTA